MESLRDVGRWSSVRRIFDYTYKFWPAGFYNKTFMWPGWRFYERTFRRAAGFADCPVWKDLASGPRWFHHNLHCDVLVIGAGPAGLAAALTASDAGSDVVVVEMEPEIGGSLLYEVAQIDGHSADSWVHEIANEIQKKPNVRLLTSSMATGCFDHNMVTVIDRSSYPIRRFLKVRAKEVVLASGAIEQPLVFENNDLPGIMTAKAAQQYVTRYAVMPFRSAVVATTNDSAYEVAEVLHRAGIDVRAIVDARASVPVESLEFADAAGIRVFTNSAIVSAKGRHQVTEVVIAKLGDRTDSIASIGPTIHCCGVAVAGGFSPTVHLYSQAGGRVVYNDAQGSFVPDRRVPNFSVVGAAAGQYSLRDVLQSGRKAGGHAIRTTGAEPRQRAFATPLHKKYDFRDIRIAPTGNSFRQWVDLFHDVTLSDIELAVRENYKSIEHLKRFVA